MPSGATVPTARCSPGKSPTASRCQRHPATTFVLTHSTVLLICRNFVEEKMGSKYVERRSVELSKAYQESSPSTPLFFILSPGVDPLKDVEAMGEPPAHVGSAAPSRTHSNEKGASCCGDFLPSPGQRLNFTIDSGRIHNVSLGQGQEVVAERALEVAATQGHWVILQVGGGHGGGTPQSTAPTAASCGSGCPQALQPERPH